MSASAPSPAPRPLPRARAPWWAKVLLMLFVLGLIAAGVFAGHAWGRFTGATETRDTQVIRSVTQESQIILASTGVTNILEEETKGLDVLGLGLFTLPGSERKMLVRYEYDAKFGIEGGDVQIEQTGENTYRITIPEFISLGYENPDVHIASEANGVLSWTTPEIDKAEIIERVLTPEAMDEHLEGLRPLLEESARDFYTRIVHAIDPEARLSFEFASPASGSAG